MKKFLLDYISALLNDECNSLKICIRDLDQRSNSIDMYQENSLPPTTRDVEMKLSLVIRTCVFLPGFRLDRFKGINPADIIMQGP